MNFDVEFDLQKTKETLEQYLARAEAFHPTSSKLPFKRWHDEVTVFLKENFTDNTVATYFTQEASLKGAGIYYSGMSEEDRIGSYDIACARKAIRTILKGVSQDALPDRVPASRRGKKTDRVFVVHGHQEARLLEVKELLTAQGLKAIVLKDQPNGGATIIEKFETNADVDFAVVVMTADDVGAAASKAAETKPRCRQNVLLELGYFIGKLGRRHVCALVDTSIELPSDIFGVAFTPIDAAGAWKYRLADELRHAGYSIDKNKIQ